MGKFPVGRAVLAALAATLLTGVAAAQQLRVAVTSAAENAPFFSAMEHGTFSKVGLDVKVDVMPSGVEISLGRRRPVRHLPVPDRGRAWRAGGPDRSHLEQRAQEPAK